MSLVVQTTDGKGVEARFMGTFSAEGINGVQIGEHEIPLTDFCVMVRHFLGGGFGGWERGETPEVVNKTLTDLFDLYEKRDTKWVRRV